MTSEDNVNPFQSAANGFGKKSARVMSGSVDLDNNESSVSDDYQVNIDLSGAQPGIGGAVGENPFAQEMGGLQRAHSSSRASEDQVNVRVRAGSFEFDSSTAAGERSNNWTADFTEPSSAPSPSNTSKSKKKKKNPKSSETQLTLD